MDATENNSSFKEDFNDLLQKLRNKNTEQLQPTDKPSPLSSVLYGQPFATKQCLQEELFGIHDFATRFEAEEVEWFLNKPINSNNGNTCVHEMVISQDINKLALILKLGGNHTVVATVTYIASYYNNILLCR